jgi:uncharacterized protein (DUF849 family)
MNAGRQAPPSAISYARRPGQRHNGRQQIPRDVTLIRAHQDCDIIINLTTSGDLHATDETRQLHLRELKPELASYDCGSMNWQHNALFLNPPLS